jgi:hypothetical protein
MTDHDQIIRWAAAEAALQLQHVGRTREAGEVMHALAATAPDPSLVRWDDLRMGDEVMDEGTALGEVLSISRSIFEPEKRAIHFSVDRSTSIRASDDHLVRVTNR